MEIPKELTRLMDSAEASAQNRGHSIVWKIHTGHRTADAQCVRCGRYVAVNIAPLPNEINIGGEAVALNCE